VLSDGSAQYLYGCGRLGEYAGDEWAYYTTDALGSVRQIVDGSGAVVFYQAYEPYGEVRVSAGEGGSNYGYAGEWTDATGLQYLRARYYNTGVGSFLTRDTWAGDYSDPLSLNRWAYVQGNPVRYTDPSGMISCTDSDDPECLATLESLNNIGMIYYYYVMHGLYEPVSAFASFADLAYEAFDRDISGFMWGMTNLILNFDPNNTDHKLYEIGMRRKYGVPASRFRLPIHWLPYNQGEDTKKSDQGDWKAEYFDGNSDQAFHFWFFAALTYYENPTLAQGGNFYHDPVPLEIFCGEDLEKFADLGGNDLYDFLARWHIDAGNTNPADFNLSIAAIKFGSLMLEAHEGMEFCDFDSCTKVPVVNIITVTSPGTWIRDNLQEK
jgi:RHS repeat-associated protein